MTNELFEKIIVGVISGLIIWAIIGFFIIISKNIKGMLKNSKARKPVNAKVAVFTFSVYLFLIASIVLAFVFLEFNKLFVLVIVFLFFILLLLIVIQLITYIVSNITYNLQKNI